MKINGWWLAIGLMGLSDYAIFNIVVGYNWRWIQIFNVIFIFIGFGLAFKETQSD